MVTTDYDDMVISLVSILAEINNPITINNLKSFNSFIKFTINICLFIYFFKEEYKKQTNKEIQLKFNDLEFNSIFDLLVKEPKLKVSKNTIEDNSLVEAIITKELETLSTTIKCQKVKYAKLDDYFTQKVKIFVASIHEYNFNIFLTTP
jgi:hypothetical protein